MTKKQIVGLTGFARSGKSELMQHMADNYGFSVIGASEIIRQELQSETGRTTFSREELREKGAQIKHEQGPDYVVRYALEDNSDKVVIDGIRNLIAAQALRNCGGFMIGLVARPEVRFARDGLARDAKQAYPTLEAMATAERAEMNSPDRYGLQVLKVLLTLPPSQIIDTSDMTIDEVSQAADSLLEQRQIIPASTNTKAS